MRKILKSVVILSVLLALTTSPVFAGTALELIEVRNDGAGPTFIFRVSGDFTKQELSDGFVNVSGGEIYTLYCGAKQTGDTIVCHTTKKASGHNVVIGFGNARFWTFVPLPNVCYSIWDWLISGPDAWTKMGQHCQEGEANDGDKIEYYNNYSNTYQSVMFFEIYTPLPGTCAVIGEPPVNEAGYYFPICP